MPLTEIECRNAKRAEKSYKLTDEKGMYLEVMPTGAKYWRMQYRYGGKQKRLALGVYPEVALKEAREKRQDARVLIADGIDPAAKKKIDKLTKRLDSENSFEAIALEWHAKELARWTQGHAARVWTSLEIDVLPDLGKLPIADLQPALILSCIKKIEKRGAIETAGRVLQRISNVLRYAVQTGRITSNPARELAGVVTAKKVEHRAALPRKELPEFYRRLDAEPLHRVTRLAMELLMLTMVRPGELRGARWEEFDLERNLWLIPAERMKMRSPHIVPLSRQALAILDELRSLTGHRELVFPAQTDLRKPMSENTLGYALGRMGYKDIATAHGMRALASTILNEEGFNPDAIERQLAHAERNKVRAAYHRTEYLEDRTKMLQWYADFLDSKKPGANIIAGQFPKAA